MLSEITKNQSTDQFFKVTGVDCLDITIFVNADNGLPAKESGLVLQAHYLYFIFSQHRQSPAIRGPLRFHSCVLVELDVHEGFRSFGPPYICTHFRANTENSSIFHWSDKCLTIAGHAGITLTASAGEGLGNF